MSWDLDSGIRSFDVTPVSSNIAIVNGATINLNVGDSFKETVVNLARDAGFRKFRTFLNGSEISPETAPSVIEDGMMLEIKPYDAAGSF